MGRSNIFCLWGKKNIDLLEGSQASLARPSGKGSMKVYILG